jgi:hypothetical protein
MNKIKIIIGIVVSIVFILYIVLIQECMRGLRFNPRMSKEQYSRDKWQCLSIQTLNGRIHNGLQSWK